MQNMVIRSCLIDKYHPVVYRHLLLSTSAYLGTRLVAGTESALKLQQFINI